MAADGEAMVKRAPRLDRSLRNSRLIDRAENEGLTRAGNAHRRDQRTVSVRARDDNPRAPSVAGFVVPELPIPFVARDGLLQLIDAAIADPIVLLCAPAGCGKTTLLTSWIRSDR